MNRISLGIVADPCDPQKPGGLGRCIFELVRSLVGTASSNMDITVYSKSDLFLNRTTRKPLSGNIWLTGARQLDPTLDVYIFFTPVIPLFFKPKCAIVIVEDLAYLELPRRTFREKIMAFASYLMHRRSLRLADKVICISKATAASVEHFFNISQSSCAIIPLAAMLLPLASEAIPEVPKKFFFFAGIIKGRKNVANIVRAFALFAEKDKTYGLVIAGRKEGAYYQAIAALAERLGVSKRIQFVGHMSDGQMTALYNRAEALVFPSKVEGFGMPVLEAFVAGVPVITSKYGATAEVAGNAALLVEPDSPESIAAALEQISQDGALRDRLRELGKRRAKYFSWGESGKALARLIEQIGTTSKKRYTGSNETREE